MRFPDQRPPCFTLPARFDQGLRHTITIARFLSIWTNTQTQFFAKRALLLTGNFLPTSQHKRRSSQEPLLFAKLKSATVRLLRPADV